MKDLPCDLYGSNDSRKTFVEENDILQTNQLKQCCVQSISEVKGVRPRYERRQRRLVQLYHSRPTLMLD